MKPVCLTQLAKILKTEPAGTGVFTGVSTDSRTVKPGDCFVAIKGPNFDGHDHIDQALQKGALCAISQDNSRPAHDRVLKVKDTIKALGDLARWYRRQLHARVVAITGSAGKTTTRNLIHHVASRHFAAHQSPKSFNNNIGLPLTILSTEDRHEVLVAELGSNAPGEIAYLTSIAQPDIALVTNVHPAHLEGFGCIENIVKEKSSISLGLEPDGVFLINGDFRNLLEYSNALPTKVSTFGTAAHCHITAADMKTTGSSGSLTVDGTQIRVPLAGTANLQNVLAAWAVCKHLGMSVTDFARAIETFDHVDMRLQIEKTGTLTILNDCYNANPASMTNAIECLTRIADRSARTVFICGQMAELGDRSEQLHARLGARIASAGIDILLAVGPWAGTTAQAARKDANTDFQCHVFDDNAQLCNNLVDIIRADDIILVKGSRSAALEKAVEKLKQLFP